jgi:hypothetical protein
LPLTCFFSSFLGFSGLDSSASPSGFGFGLGLGLDSVSSSSAAEEPLGQQQ